MSTAFAWAAPIIGLILAGPGITCALAGSMFAFSGVPNVWLGYFRTMGAMITLVLVLSVICALI